MMFKSLKMTLPALAVLLCAGGGFAAPAYAGHGHHHGHGNELHHSYDRHGDEDSDGWSDGRAYRVIGGHDRAVIRDYIVYSGRGFCPPGHARAYRVGYTLPRDVVYIPVGHDLYERLAPVPAGYRYVQVDKDVLLIGEASKKVIDAVTLLSALGE